MVIDINKVGNYNGRSFLGNSSAKPIVGVPLRSIYTFDFSQGKLATDEAILPGQPIKAINKTSDKTGAGKALNPNVLELSKPSTVNDISGFLLVNETDVLNFGETASKALKGQIVNVALLGSRIELYLPISADANGVNTNSKLEWDIATNTLKVSTSGNIDLIGPIVDGVKFTLNGNDVVYEDCKVAKVRV